MADKSVPAGRKTAIEIPLPTVRKYVGGSGPPPPRITLAPPRDSTAYIIDQFVLPTDEETTETSRRLIHYHIGFTDLPAVKILIPCNEVLDYVSPRELEDWEYMNLDTREEERARLLAKKQQAIGAAKMAALSSNLSAADAGIAVPSPTDEALRLVKQVAGPSLSTPRKRTLGQMLDEDLGDSNGDSDDAAIHRQLHGVGESDGTRIEYDLEDSESVDELALHSDMTGPGTPSRTRTTVATIHQDKQHRGHKMTPANPSPPDPLVYQEPKARVGVNRKKQQEPATDEWEVKDLLDDQWFLEQGAKVHKYLVLWEGNWPEDQNPTWEPAENVQDETLVKKYHMKKKAGLLKPPNKKQKTMHHYLSRTQYSSVAEAFEGDIGEHTETAAGDTESDTEEQFLVTENAGDIAGSGTKPGPSFRSFDNILARYNESLARG
ncbi:hypothetical protein BT67DRAFT_435900 [Trichocladium antarcticum]|uniref:Chromo domain-containing protein n=1 Tax=Trichocladium antarcticum TaxID=1450529 RepID=A0AAN6ZBE7_9PEZI|nr:hypothetical protein BT67DRAFT_435900 [Trichocladium antarcticum]